MKLIIFSLVLVFAGSIKQYHEEQLHIYGGKNHDQYLGCLTCGDDQLKSIWCTFGDYGSRHMPKAIWNELGKYGSVSSQYSPFNENAKYPPIILDDHKRFRGYLTVNKNNQQRCKNYVAGQICASSDQIRGDIKAWYDWFVVRYY
ncbi:hypothetical protein [Mucilaginibacter endophyticus]|uniref:hypothetical protein n=1 Tax=Mucilaginibacter endophyticus TaxID=2675003 RepID=UPI000E0DA5AC|nr:hypothetical protein [Mucilaginibacter endophyticus]